MEFRDNVLGRFRTRLVFSLGDILVFDNAVLYCYLCPRLGGQSIGSPGSVDRSALVAVPPDQRKDRMATEPVMDANATRHRYLKGE